MDYQNVSLTFNLEKEKKSLTDFWSTIWLDLFLEALIFTLYTTANYSESVFDFFESGIFLQKIHIVAK